MLDDPIDLWEVYDSILYRHPGYVHIHSCTFLCIVDETSDLNIGTSLIQFVVCLYINHIIKNLSYRTGIYTVFHKANADYFNAGTH